MLLASTVVGDSVNLAKAIDEYGPIAVIIGVFIAIVIFMILSNYNSNKKLIEALLENTKEYQESIKKQNDELIERISKKDQNKEKDLTSIFIKLNSTLKNECKKAQNILNADALRIYVVHNGTMTSHGLPFFKMSCICEWIKKGTGAASRIREHSGLPLTLFDKLISGLFENGEFIIGPSNSSNPNLKIFISGHKVVNCICVAIYDTENNIMGFMSAELAYDIINDKNKLKEVREELWDLGSTIRPVLDYSGINDSDNND